jgi:hypothetical protein
LSILFLKKATGTLQSNRTCNIPFNYQGADRYFCTSVGSKYQCEVGELGSGMLEECNRGS